MWTQPVPTSPPSDFAGHLPLPLPEFKMTILATIRTEELDIEVSDKETLRFVLDRLLTSGIDCRDPEVHFLQDMIKNVNPAPTPFNCGEPATQSQQSTDPNPHSDPFKSTPITGATAVYEDNTIYCGPFALTLAPGPTPTVDNEKLPADEMGFMLNWVKQYREVYHISYLEHDEDIAKMICRLLEDFEVIKHSSIYGRCKDELNLAQERQSRPFNPFTAQQAQSGEAYVAGSGSIEALADEIHERDSAEKDCIIRILRAEVAALRKAQQPIDLQTLLHKINELQNERDQLVETINQQGQAILMANQRTKELEAQYDSLTAAYINLRRFVK